MWLFLPFPDEKGLVKIFFYLPFIDTFSLKNSKKKKFKKVCILVSDPTRARNFVARAKTFFPE